MRIEVLTLPLRRGARNKTPKRPYGVTVDGALLQSMRGDDRRFATVTAAYAAGVVELGAWDAATAPASPHTAPDPASGT